jgi:serine/threonine protein phosphatase PrpC
MNKEKITFYGKTDMGRQRTNNEDALVVEYLDPETVLAIAIDGVGGYEGGEVAAEIAQKEIPSYLKEF